MTTDTGADRPAQENADADAPPLIVAMGVSGSGKSTVGAALAQRLRVPFADADDFHPPANIAKMTAGEALDDDDRHPWLEAIGEWLAAHAEHRWRDELLGAEARTTATSCRQHAPERPSSCTCTAAAR